MHSITIQQANTSDGSYDPKVALPKPVTLEQGEPRTVYLGHPTNRGPELGSFVGVVTTPGGHDLEHTLELPQDPEDLVGKFLVIAEAGRFYCDLRVIERVVSHEEEPAA